MFADQLVNPFSNPARTGQVVDDFDVDSPSDLFPAADTAARDLSGVTSKEREIGSCAVDRGSLGRARWPYRPPDPHRGDPFVQVGPPKLGNVHGTNVGGDGVLGDGDSECWHTSPPRFRVTGVGIVLGGPLEVGEHRPARPLLQLAAGLDLLVEVGARVRVPAVETIHICG